MKFKLEENLFNEFLNMCLLQFRSILEGIDEPNPLVEAFKRLTLAEREAILIKTTTDYSGKVVEFEKRFADIEKKLKDLKV